jgi:hypothetical protein
VAEPFDRTSPRLAYGAEMNGPVGHADVADLDVMRELDVKVSVFAFDLSVEAALIHHLGELTRASETIHCAAVLP